MKKVINSICTWLFATILLLGNTPASNMNGYTVTAENAKITNPVITLNAFDSHADLSLISMYAAFGKIELNKDKTYIQNGEGSAKMTVTHEPYVGATGDPRWLQVTKSNATGTDYSDFSRVFMIDVKVYNAQTETRRIGISMFYTASGTTTEWFDLAPEQWTTVSYRVYSDLIPVVKNNRLGTKSKTVNSITFVYERPTDAEDVFYMDDFNIYQKASAEVEEYDFGMANDEIASFDKYWQFKYCSIGANEKSAYPIVSWVQLPEQMDKKGVLKCELSSGTAASGAFVELTNQLLSKIDWEKYDGKDGKDEYELCFDVYVPEDNEMDLEPYTFYMDFMSGNMPLYGHRFSLVNGWNTIRVPFVERVIYAPVAVKEPVYGFTRAPKMRLTYLAQKNPTTIYFDNFRMEKVEANA